MSEQRILHVLASLDRGGAESMLMNIYRRIDRTSVQFDFVVNERPQQYAYEAEIGALGGRVFRMPKASSRQCIAYGRQWHQLLAEHPEWQVIHGHHTSPGVVYFSQAHIMGRQTIAHSHTAGADSSIKGLAKRFSRYPLRYQADHLFACSRAAAKWMFGRQAYRAHIVKNAIDIGLYSFSSDRRLQVRTKLGVHAKLVVGHVGNFLPPKNHEFVLAVFAEILKRRHDSVLLLVGDGPLRRRLARSAIALGVASNVIFAGSRTDVPDLMQAMDLFLFPSQYEGLGMALVEAQASGLPCVVSNTIPEEATVTDLVTAMSLSTAPSKWATAALDSYQRCHRRNRDSELSAAGYDDRRVAAWLSTFYAGIARAPAEAMT